MIQIKQYVKASSLDEAYELNQKRNNVIIGGMHWLKMMSKNIGTAIDLSGLGLDQIVETEDAFEIGCMVSLRQLELHQGLNAYSNGAVRDAVKDIVGTQFRNTATVGGSIYGRYGFSDVLTVFLAMDTTVVLHKAGEIPLETYAQMKADRDILVKLIVKKNAKYIAYQAQRHARTDFPILTCAVGYVDGQWRAAVGARPMRAVLVKDEKNLLTEIDEKTAADFALAVSDELSFGSNMRSSDEYRRMIAPVLIRRAILSAAGKED
mgnify:CR=1 FL=1